MIELNHIEIHDEFLEVNLGDDVKVIVDGDSDIKLLIRLFGYLSQESSRVGLINDLRPYKLIINNFLIQLLETYGYERENEEE